MSNHWHPCIALFRSLPLNALFCSSEQITTCAFFFFFFLQDCLFMNVMAPSTGSSYSQCAKSCDFDLKKSYPYKGVCSDDMNIPCDCLDSPNETVCGPLLAKPSKGFPVMVYIHVSRRHTRTAPAHLRYRHTRPAPT